MVWHGRSTMIFSLYKDLRSHSTLVSIGTPKEETDANPT
jgi:hypothetical protein